MARRRNKYEGPASCYALHEGCYVPGYGVDDHTGAAIAALILRDLYRGWTYDHRCNRIPMTEDLAHRRLRYLIALCYKHRRSPAVCEELREIVEYAIAHHRLPPWVTVFLAGPRAEKVAEELRRLGIASRVVVLGKGETMPSRPALEKEAVAVVATRRRRVRR